MGQQQSVQTQKFLENFQRQYQNVKQVNDPRFGEIQVYRNKTSPQLIMIKTYWCKSEQDQKNCFSLCEKLAQQDNKYLLKLLGYHSNVSNQLCADFTKISIYFEYFENTLEKEIEARHQVRLVASYFVQKQQLYSEPELWLTLFSMASACRFLEERNQYLGDIRPQNIMLTTENQIKLIVICSDFNGQECSAITGDKSGFLRAYYNKDKAYLAPELLPFVQDSNTPPPQLITYKAEIFSLGITLLECSTLISARSLYTTHNNGMALNIDLMSQMLEQIKQLGYSAMWYRIVRELIRERPEERPTFSDLMVCHHYLLFFKEVLAPYQNEILNLQPFQLLTQQQDQTKFNYGVVQPNPNPTYSKPQFVPSYYPPQEFYAQQPIVALSPMKPIKYEEVSDYKQIQPVQFITLEPSKTTYQYQPQPQEYQYLRKQFQNLIWLRRHLHKITRCRFHKHSNLNSCSPKSPKTSSHFNSQPKIYKVNSHTSIKKIDYMARSDDNSGLSDLDKKIQQALKSSQETAKRHYQTPTYF